MKNVLTVLCVFLFYFCAYTQNNYKQYLQLSYAEMDSLMKIEYDRGSFDKAIPFMQAGREKAKNEFGEQDSVFAAYTNNLGVLYWQMGEYDLALPLFIQGKDVIEKALGKDHPMFANSLNHLANLYFNTGNYEMALAFNIESKDIREKVLGKKHPDYALSLNNLAQVYESIGNYDMALPLYIQAKEIQEKVLPKDHPEFAGLLLNLAGLHYQMGNFDMALPLLVQSKDITERTLGKDHPDFANTISNLAYLYGKVGNYDMALPLFIQAKDILGKTLGEDHSDFATAVNNLAGVYESMGNYDMALPLYIQAKDITENALGKDHPDFAISLNNLAFLHQSMKNYHLALPLYIQAKDINEKVFGKNHPDFAISLNNLAGLYEIMENYEMALPLYIQSKSIYEKALGKDHPLIASSMVNLAGVYESLGNYKLAWSTVLQAMNVCIGFKLNHDFTIQWKDSVLNASFASNEYLERMVGALLLVYSLLEKDRTIENAVNKQIIVADLAINLLSKWRNQLSREKDKLRILAQSNKWLQNSLKVLNPKEHSNKAFNLSDQNKSVLLLQAIKSEENYRLGELPDSLASQDKKLLKKQNQLQAQLLENRSEEEKSQLLDELNNVNQNIEAFVEKIKKEYPKYHQLKYQQVDAKVEEIQALLDENTVLLEYVIDDSIVHIFLVDKKQVEWKKSLINNKELTNNIQKLHQSLSNYSSVPKDKEIGDRNYTQTAYWFYQKLIAPVLKNKQNIQNLIIVSDGELGHLPFETFLVEPAPQTSTNYQLLHYLVNDYNISYNYSATLWKENKLTPAPKNNGQILAMAANYDIKLDSAMKGLRLPTDLELRTNLATLPSARNEVKTLQKNYQGFFAFDALASEKTVKEKAADFAILHFAMHGILDADKPMLSSLAFTEDKDSTESNFWQAHEISKIKLNANLVVLSACETGYGKFEMGNGIASLARAFMYAGASAMIVSLWQVNDYATSEIMKNLYANLAAGMKKDEALRQAKIKYIKEAQGIAAHPAFWSPFIMMGNTEAVHIKTKGGILYWVIGGVVALVLGGGWMLRRRRDKIEVG